MHGENLKLRLWSSLHILYWASKCRSN